MPDPIQFGVVGIHGFARSHLRQLKELADAGQCRIAAAVAHAREQDEAFASELEAQGIELLPDLDSLLAIKDRLDVITLPVGTPLHVPMAIEVLQADVPTYMEKPVTGAVEDLRRLEKAVAAATVPFFVGYQSTYAPTTTDRKRRLVAGEFGQLKRVVVTYAWPRHFGYYGRNGWAGRLQVPGSYVLDSPANNACSHGLNMALYLAGSEFDQAATPTSVTAELYRANDIESADVTSLRVETAEGVEIVFNAAHCCEKQWGPVFRLECSNGEMLQLNDASWRLTPGADGDAETTGPDHCNPFASVIRYVGGDTNTPVCTLAIAGSQTIAVNGAFTASPIHTIPASDWVEGDLGDYRYRYVPGLNEILETCHEKGALLSEVSEASWLQSARTADVTNLETLTLAEMRE